MTLNIDSERSGLLLPLSEYPDIHDLIQWDKVFPQEQSEQLLKLLEKQRNIVEALNNLANPEGPLLQELAILKRDSEKIPVSETENEEIKSIEEFFDTALSFAKEKVRLRKGNRDSLRTVLENDWGSILLRSTIIDAAVTYTLGNTTIFTDLKKQLINCQVAREKAAKRVKKESYEEKFEKYQAKIHKLQKDKSDVMNEISSQKDEDESHRQQKIKQTILNVERAREVEAKKLIEIQHKITEGRKGEEEENLVKSLSSVDDSKLEPLKPDTLSKLEPRAVIIKQEEESTNCGDISNIMMKRFQEENKRGRIHVREERRKRREDRAQRRANGEKNVSEDEPYESEIDGIFSDEGEKNNQVLEADKNQNNDIGLKKHLVQDDQQNGITEDEENEKMAQLEKVLFGEVDEDDSQQNSVKQEISNIEIPVNFPEPFTVDPNQKNVNDLLRSAIENNENTQRSSYALNAKERADNYNQSNYQNNLVHQYNERTTRTAIPFTEHSKNWNDRTARYPNITTSYNDNRRNRNQLNYNNKKRPGGSPSPPAVTNRPIGSQSNAQIPPNLFIVKPTDPRKRPRY